MLDSFLTYNPNTWPPHLSIQSHVLGDLKLWHVLLYHLTPIFLRPPLPLLIPANDNRSHLLTGAFMLLLRTCPNHLSIASHISTSIGATLTFCLNIFIPNLIQPRVPAHLSQHPHFYHFHLLGIRILGYPTFRPIQHGWSNQNLPFKFRQHFLVTQDSSRVYVSWQYFSNQHDILIDFEGGAMYY